MKHDCELCGAEATHFCKCEGCLDALESDAKTIGYRNRRVGRWLCDHCGLMRWTLVKEETSDA